MDEREQVSAFAGELECLVARFGDEFDVSVAAMVGVLTMKATQLSCDAMYDIDGDDDSFDIDLD